MKMSPLDRKLVKKLMDNLNPKETRKEIQKANLESYNIYKYINESL